jgi:hypothetical protein
MSTAGWVEVRAAMVKAGDKTTFGEVASVALFGELYLVELTVAGRLYTRSFDDIVPVWRTQ